jgi:hypothetical protein
MLDWYKIPWLELISETGVSNEELGPKRNQTTQRIGSPASSRM